MLAFVALSGLGGPLATAAPGLLAAPDGTVIARTIRVTQHMRAFGDIRPVAVVVERAVEAGTVRHMVLPGTRVARGQELAVIAGPQAEALLERRRSAVRADHARLAADRRQFAAQLVTRQQLAADQAAYETARSALRAAVHTLTVRAPGNGQVLQVAVADGARVAAGQRLMTVQTGRLWVQAKFYGPSSFAIHPGMTGRFLPATGGATVPVKVMSVAAALGTDGGERVLLGPTGTGAAGAAWRSGQWGTVLVNGATRVLVAVPTRALILDRAQWWVLVHTTHGDRRQPVKPGPTRGWVTYLEHGVRAGEHVVVRNAYLEFHRGIAGRYAPPY